MRRLTCRQPIVGIFGFATVMAVHFAIGATDNVQQKPGPGENVAAVLREDALKLVIEADLLPTNEAVPKLRLATDCCRNALSFYSQKRNPGERAATQLELGTSLLALGRRLGEKDAIPPLEEAARVLQDASSYYRGLAAGLPAASAGDSFVQLKLGEVYQRHGSLLKKPNSLPFLEKAITAFQAALKYHPEAEASLNRANILVRLGNTRMVLALDNKTNLVVHGNAAVAVYIDALKIYTKDQHPDQWAEVQGNLGVALSIIAPALSGAEHLRTLDAAGVACHKALEVFSLQRNPKQWAVLKEQLGDVLCSLMRVSGPEAGKKFALAAFGAYNDAQEYVTKERDKLGWELLDLGKFKASTEHAFFSKDWDYAAKNYAILYEREDNDRHYYLRLAYCYHEGLGNYARAFALHEAWFKRHPEDRDSLPDFAESNFVTSRFAAAADIARKVQAQLAQGTGDQDKRDQSALGAMRAIEIASFVADGDLNGARAALAGFINDVDALPADFRVSWSWGGTRRFIETSNDPGVVGHRSWLLAFVSAMEQSPRDSMLAKLRALPPLAVVAKER